jgi:hypothetical protein
MAHKLILHPRAPEDAPRDLALLRSSLEDIGLLGREFRLAGRVHHLPGESFLQLVTFLGCSPRVALDPPAGAEAAPSTLAEAFCHVRLDAAAYPEARLLGAEDMRPPRCRACRRDVADWARLAPVGSGGAMQLWRCPNCGHTAPLWTLDWRRGAAFTRFSIEIWGVYPHEAIPSDRLLAAVRCTSHGDWAFFYLTR